MPTRSRREGHAAAADNAEKRAHPENAEEGSWERARCGHTPPRQTSALARATRRCHSSLPLVAAAARCRSSLPPLALHILCCGLLRFHSPRYLACAVGSVEEEDCAACCWDWDWVAASALSQAAAFS